MKHATQRHWNVLALLTLVTLVAPPFLFWTSTFAQVKKPITKEGLVAAIRLKGFSTKELIKQIETRGVSFQMTSEAEAEMRGAGAQPELIEAARSNYRAAGASPAPNFPKGVGALTINAPPASKVFVNGKLRGTTNEAGVLIISPLKAGQYTVTLKKDTYEDLERSVAVALGVENTELFSLSPVKGQLTVHPSIPDAQVSLDGVGYPAGISNLSIPAGSYEVKVSKPGYRTFSKSITVTPRASSTVDAPLQPVPTEELLAQTISYFGAQRYREAISSGQGILALHPNSPEALMLTGLAHYYLGQYSDSSEYLSKALTFGAEVILPIRHHHRAFLNDALCAGRITIGHGMLTFSSMDKTGHDFSVPANKIYELTFEPQKSGRVHVQVGIPKGSKEEKKTYNFHVSHTGTKLFDPSNSSSIVVLYCNDCAQETQVIYQLLKQLKDVPYQPPSAIQSTADGGGSSTLNRPNQLDSGGEGLPGRPTLTRRPPSGVASPSATYRSFNSTGKFKLAVPDNWKEVSNSGGNVMLAPDGAITKVGAQTDISHGLQVGTYPTQGQPLAPVFEQVVNLILKNSPHLRRLGVTENVNVNGRGGLAIAVGGQSPVTQRAEVVRIYVVTMKNANLFYFFAVAPQEEATAYAATFDKIIGSIEFLD